MGSAKEIHFLIEFVIFLMLLDNSAGNICLSFLSNQRCW